MEPRSNRIQELAMEDPIAAYGIILGIPRVPISINASGSFSTFDLGELPIEAGLDTTIAQRTWIDNIQYSLQQPNVFAGSVFKTLYDWGLRAQTGISIRCTVHSGPRYLVSPKFTPLENFSEVISARWAHGWPLFKQQNINVEFMLTQAPPTSDVNGPPYNVTLTFNGWQFLDHTVDEISVDVAASKLRELGFFVPKAVSCP
jgi:hypothetical protein